MLPPLVQPVRMNWCVFEIEALDTVGTALDPDYREAESYRVTNTVRLTGQLVNSKGFDRTNRTATGDSTPTTGAAVFRFKELDKVGYHPKKGDLITVIYFGTRNPYCPTKGLQPFNCSYRIIKASPLSPYRGQFLLLHVEFEQDRKIRESV